jgi:hypothetical protein
MGAQEYHLRLKQPTPALSASRGGPFYLNPQPVSNLAALAHPSALSAGRFASLSNEKYATTTKTRIFFDDECDGDATRHLRPGLWA